MNTVHFEPHHRQTSLTSTEMDHRDSLHVVEVPPLSMLLEPANNDHCQPQQETTTETETTGNNSGTTISAEQMIPAVKTPDHLRQVERGMASIAKNADLPLPQELV
jgi:hypothetical protein